MSRRKSRKIPLLRRRSLRDQVADRLRHEIASGEHASGRLPSVRELADRFSCSTMVISGALNVLEEEGRLVRSQGKGVFVSGKVRGRGGEERVRDTRGIAVYSRGDHATILDDTYYAEVWAGILHAAGESGRKVTIVQISARDAGAQALSTTAEIPLDGCIVLGIANEDMVREVMNVGLPTVVADHTFDDLDVDCVDLDSAGGMAEAVRHLAELGHREIGFMGNTRLEYNPDRYRGYLRGMAEAGLEAEERFLVRGTPNLEGGCDLMRRLLEEGRELPTAFVAGGSTMVVGAMRAMAERGLKVPADLSMVGSGSRWFTNVYPRVSIAAVDAHLVGVEAVRTLLERIENPEASACRKRVPVELVVRETTSAPRGSARRAGGGKGRRSRKERVKP